MDRALAAWWRTVRLIGAVERAAGIGLIALMVVTITIQVVTRYAFGQPLVWVEELATYSFIWAVFLGAAAGLKELRHIRIETFVGRFSARPRAVLHALLSTVVCACSITLALYAVDIMQVESRSQTISLPVNIGRHWVYSVPLFAGLASMALTGAYFAAAYGAAAWSGRPVDAEIDIEAERARDRAADEHEVRIAEKSL